MRDGEPVRGAAEPPVGDEHHVATKPGAVDRGRDREHLAHPWSALRSLVADHDDVAGLDRTAGHGLERLFLRVEHTRSARERLPLHAHDLAHRPLGRQRAPEDGDAAERVDRLPAGPYHVTVRRGRRQRRQVLFDRLARDRHRVAVQQTGLQQLSHQHRNAPDAVEVGHDEPPRRAQVADVRRPAADAIEVVELQLDVGLHSDCQQVQHRVGRASAGHDACDRVLEGLLRHHVARAQPQAQAVEHGSTGRSGELVAPLVHRGRRGAPRQRHPDRLGRHRHGVRRVHAGAGSGARARVRLDRLQLIGRDPPRGLGAHGLEYVLDRQVPAVEVSGKDGPSIEEHRGQVQSGACHEHPRQALIAAGNGDHAVEPFGVHHEFDRVGDDLSADE